MISSSGTLKEPNDAYDMGWGLGMTMPREGYGYGAPYYSSQYGYGPPPLGSQPPPKSNDLMVVLSVIALVVTVVATIIAYMAFVNPREPKETVPKERAGYIKQIDEICGFTANKAAELGEPPTYDPVLYGQYMMAKRQILAEFLAAWSRIKMPPGDANKLNEMFSIIRSILSEMYEMARMVNAGDFQEGQRIIAKIRTLADKLYPLMLNYGFQTCSVYATP